MFIGFTPEAWGDRLQLLEYLKNPRIAAAFHAWASRCWHKGFADGNELVTDLDGARIDDPQSYADRLLRYAESAEWLECGKWIAPFIAPFGLPAKPCSQIDKGKWPAFCFGWEPIRDRNGFCSPLSELWQWLQKPLPRLATPEQARETLAFFDAQDAEAERLALKERILTGINAEGIVDAFRQIHQKEPRLF